MGNKSVITISITILAILLGIQLYVIYEGRKEIKEDPYIEEIKRLEKKLDSLTNTKDSLRIVIDSTHVKIINNEKHYKEVINTIINQSSSSDSCFITDYIRQYRNQNNCDNIR